MRVGPTACATAAAAALLSLGACAGKTGQAQDAVKLLLIDPGSAQFRNVVGYPAGNVTRVCGEVNAKNRFGGYVGFQKFVVDLRKNDARIDPGQPELTLESAAAVDAYAAGQRFRRRYDNLCSDADDEFASRLLNGD